MGKVSSYVRHVKGVGPLNLRSENASSVGRKHFTPVFSSTKVTKTKIQAVGFVFAEI